MTINDKVAKLLSIRADLEQFDFEGLKGENLWNALWLTRKIKHIIAGSDKVAGLDRQGSDRLFMEADAVEGVYEFSAIDSLRLDQKTYDARICERFGVAPEALEALKNECKTKSTTVRLDFNKKYSV